MATVFLAQREGEDGPASYVIIKAIHRQLSSDQSFRAMFLDEARLTQRLRHANVVTAGELGEHHGVLYLVMELVHGVSLRQLLEALATDQRRLLPEVAVYLAVRTAEGLHAAHTLVGDDKQPLNVVHRDVTPDNLLIGFDGGLRVIDFGVAKARDRIAPTSMGIVKGKFGYMAPEQARGTAVDARTDVFSLAIVLWEMLTSKRVVTVTNDAMAFEWARNPTIAPPSSVVPGITPALDAVLARAFSIDPAGRPSDMSAFAAELLAACPGASQGTAGHISMLLATVVTPRIEETRLALPPDVAEVMNGGRAPSNPESLAQLTVKLQDGYVSDFGASAMGPTEVARMSNVAQAAAPKAAVAVAPAVKIQGQTPVGYKPPAPSSALKPGAAKALPAPKVGVGAGAPKPVAAPVVAAPVAEPPTVTSPGSANVPTVVTPVEPPTVTSPAVAPVVAAPVAAAAPLIAPPVEVLIAPPPAPTEGLVPSTPPPAMAAPVAQHAPAPVAGIAPPPSFVQPENPMFGGAPAQEPVAQPAYAAPQQASPAMHAAQGYGAEYAAGYAAASSPGTVPAQQPVAEPQPAPVASGGGGGKKILGLFAVLVVLGVIVSGGYYAYARYAAAQALAAAGVPPVVPTVPAVTPPVAATPPVVPPTTTPTAIVVLDAGSGAPDAAANPLDAAAEASSPQPEPLVAAAPPPTTTTMEAAPAPAPAPAMDAPPPSMQTTAPSMQTTTTAMTTAQPSMTTTSTMQTTTMQTAMTPAMTTTMIARPDF